MRYKNGYKNKNQKLRAIQEIMVSMSKAYKVAQYVDMQVIRHSKPNYSVKADRRNAKHIYYY